MRGWSARWACWQAAWLVGALSLAASAEGLEPVECILDSDCARGACVDLLCVESKPAAAAPSEPEPSAPPREGREATVESAPAEQTPSIEQPSPPKSRRRARRAERRPGYRARVRPVRNLESRSPEPWRGEVADDVPAPTSSKRVWYGGPLLATYAVPPLAMIPLFEARQGAPLALSLFAAPIVHWVNKKAGKGFLALFMQPVFAGVGTLLGSAVCDHGSCTGELVAGAFLGYAGWVAIDVGVQAYKEAPVSVGVYQQRDALGLEVGGVW